MSETDARGGADAGAGGDSESGVVTKLSSRSVAETASLFTNLLVSKGLKIFNVIDQSAEARLVGLKLRETILVIFGNPVGGTPVMVASPLAALDLPLKVLVWADEADEGQTKVSYISPDALAVRYHLSAEVVANLRGIDALTDALVTR
jgi:uncharacterized protein (DUF302 family)